MGSKGLREYGGVLRHALETGPDGALYAMLTGAILRTAPETSVHEPPAQPPSPIAAGGTFASGGLVCASGSHVCRFDVPGL